MIWSFVLGISAAWSESAYVLNPNQQSIYSGISYGKWGQFESKGLEKSVPDTVTNLFWYSQYSKGIHPRMDVTVAFPFQHTSIGDAAPNTDMFATSSGLRNFQIQSKYQLFGPDIDSMGLFQRLSSVMDGMNRVAIVGGVSTGAWNATNRGRLTNIGEGTTDIYAGLLGEFNWIIMSSSLDLRYWMKTPTASGAMSQYPGDDITYSYDLNLNIPHVLYLGGFVDGYYRLTGVDYPAKNVPQIEQFTALQGSQTKLGSKFGITMGGLSAHGYFAKAIHAKNNPSDEWMIGMGIGYFYDKASQKNQQQLQQEVEDILETIEELEGLFENTETSPENSNMAPENSNMEKNSEEDQNTDIPTEETIEEKIDTENIDATNEGEE